MQNGTSNRTGSTYVGIHHPGEPVVQVFEHDGREQVALTVAPGATLYFESRDELYDWLLRARTDLIETEQEAVA